MSRDEVLNLTDSNIVSAPEADQDDELRQYAVRQIQLLDRHSSRFDIPDAPSHLHYEWHLPDAETHTRLVEKGFKRDDELGAKSSYSNSDGTGIPMIGDVVCYSIDKRKYQILKAIEHKAAMARNDPEKVIRNLQDQVDTVEGLEMNREETRTRGSRVTQGEMEQILREVG